MKTWRLALALGIVALLFVPARAQNLEADLQRAIQKETTSGDLKAAIEDYRKIVDRAGTNKPVAAQALLRMANCHERLEKTAEAQRIYAQIVRDFPGQSEAVSVARMRQVAATPATAPATTAATSRRLWARHVAFGAPSADGRYVSFVDFDPGADGNLFFRDMRTGAVQPVTTNADSLSYAGASVFSADGAQLAFGWTRREGYQLRVVSRTGVGERVITSNPEHLWIAPVAWSPDRSRILAKIRAKGDIGQIAWVAVADGAVQVLKTTPWNAMGGLALSPDGRFIAYDEQVEGRSGVRDIFALSADGRARTALTDGSSGNRVVGWRPDGSLAYFTSRSGRTELWAVPVKDGSASNAAVLVYRDAAGMEPLGFTSTGALIYWQEVTAGTAHVATVDWAAGRVSDIKTISTNINADFGAAWSPDGTQIAYVAHRGTVRTGGNFIAVYSVATGSTREVVPADGLPIARTGGGQWSPDGTSYVVNVQNLRGTHAIDLATGRARTLLKLTNAFPSMPQWLRGGQALLYHPRDLKQVSVRLTIRNLDTGADQDVAVGFDGPGSITFKVSPDERTVAFVPIVAKASSSDFNSSSLYVTPLTGGEPRRLVEVPPDQSLLPIAWTPDSQHLIYGRSTHGEGGGPGPRAATSGVWIVPVSGGASRQTQLPFFSSLHPDGRQVTFVRGEQQYELWILDNGPALPVAPRR